MSIRKAFKIQYLHIRNRSGATRGLLKRGIAHLEPTHPRSFKTLTAIKFDFLATPYCLPPAVPLSESLRERRCRKRRTYATWVPWPWPSSSYFPISRQILGIEERLTTQPVQNAPPHRARPSKSRYKAISASPETIRVTFAYMLDENT